MNGKTMLKLALFAYKLPKEFYRAPAPDFWPPGGVGYLKVLVRFRGPVATQWSFQLGIKEIAQRSKSDGGYANLKSPSAPL